MCDIKNNRNKRGKYVLSGTARTCNILYLNATSRHGRWHFSHLLRFAVLSWCKLLHNFGLTWVHIEHIIFRHYGVCCIICRICIFDGKWNVLLRANSYGEYEIITLNMLLTDTYANIYYKIIMKMIFLQMFSWRYIQLHTINSLTIYQIDLDSCVSQYHCYGIAF